MPELSPINPTGRKPLGQLLCERKAVEHRKRRQPVPANRPWFEPTPTVSTVNHGQLVVTQHDHS